MYQPNREQAEADRAAAYEAGVPHGEGIGIHKSVLHLHTAGTLCMRLLVMQAWLCCFICTNQWLACCLMLDGCCIFCWTRRL
jgi:hypothetical protein